MNTPQRRTGLAFPLAWGALAFALLLLLPGLKSHMPFWSADSPEYSAGMLAVAYLAGALVLTVMLAIGRPVGAVRAVSITVFFFCLAFLYFLLQKPAPMVSRSIILAIFAAAIVMTLLGFRLK